MSEKCPVCGSDIEEPKYTSNEGTSFHHYSCKRCGDYSVDYSFSSLLPDYLNNDKQKIATLSHWIRIRHEEIAKEPPNEQFLRKTILLNKELVDNIIKNQPPNPAEQADNFILWLGNSNNPPGELVWVVPETHQSIMGAITPDGFELVLYHLMDEGILQGNKAKAMGAPGRAYVALSFDGWQYYEKLRKGTTDSRKAFMAMKYGEKPLEDIVEKNFKPAVKKTGFDLFKLEDRPEAGLIDDKLRIEIQTSLFLIADLTHENAGAYWEAGYAEGLGKPVIYTCEKKKFEETKTHFDTNHHLTIPWDKDNLMEATEKLKATIRATLPEQAKLTDD